MYQNTGEQSVYRMTETNKTEAETKHRRRRKHFTFHLFDAAQSVFEGVQRGGLVIVSLFSGQVKLQLF